MPFFKKNLNVVIPISSDKNAGKVACRLIFLVADMYIFLVFLIGCNLAQSLPADFTAEFTQLPCKA